MFSLSIRDHLMVHWRSTMECAMAKCTERTSEVLWNTIYVFAIECLWFRFLLSGYTHEHVTVFRHFILPKHQLVWLIKSLLYILYHVLNMFLFMHQRTPLKLPLKTAASEYIDGNHMLRQQRKSFMTIFNVSITTSDVSLETSCRIKSVQNGIIQPLRCTSTH